MPESQTVSLAGKTYVVAPQKHTYLKRQLGGLIDSLSEGDLGADASLLELISGKAYEVLSILIPEFMPRWEFEGFADEQAYQADDYDESTDNAPTVPEITAAIGRAIEINGLDKVKLLGNLVSPELVRALIAQNIAEIVGRSAMRSSPTSASTSGESALTSSTTTPPTPEAESAGSPSPASPPSSPAASVGSS